MGSNEAHMQMVKMIEGQLSELRESFLVENEDLEGFQKATAPYHELLQRITAPDRRAHEALRHIKAFVIAQRELGIQLELADTLIPMCDIGLGNIE
jgi:hypothetical protein